MSVRRWIRLLACGGLVSCHPEATNLPVDYGRVFGGADWSTSEAFSTWAEPLVLRSTERTPCDEAAMDSLSDLTDSVLFCQRVAALEPETGVGRPELIWAILHRPSPSVDVHDCSIGLVFLDGEQRIVEASPAACRYALDVEDPSDTPVMVFRVRRTREIGVVVEWHGAECGGTAVLRQEGPAFRRVYEISTDCLR